MLYLILCLTVFLIGYTLNLTFITVGYHRGLAHQAVVLRPWAKRALVATGNWVTGLDPKAWVVMHRMHHEFSDTPKDPHSPSNSGILGIGMEQLRSYERVIRGLAKEDPDYTRHAKDLDFPLNKLNLKRRWYVPYLVQVAIALALGVSIGWLLAAAYFFGMMSHPIQGGLVNAFGHAIGGRNFDTEDNSRNNHVVAWLIFGEGFQNNHHRYPTSARFSYRWYEIDLGYVMCLALEGLTVLQVQRNRLMPRHEQLQFDTRPAADNFAQ